MNLLPTTRIAPLIILAASVAIALYLLSSASMPLLGFASYFGPPGEPDYPGCIQIADPSTGQYGELCCECMGTCISGVSATCTWSPYPACTADSSCAANTCSGSMCTDSCGNEYAGTKSCTPPSYTCQDYGYQHGTLGNCWNEQVCTPTNSCGQYNTGHTTDYWGTCSVSAPSESGCVVPTCSTNPTMNGCPCTSGANSCGYTSSGVYSGDVCTATPPAVNDACPTDAGTQCSASQCTQTPSCVAYAGQACSSSANSCGQTSSGTYSCTGSCSASVPTVIDACPTDAGTQCSASQCTQTPSCVAYAGQACYSAANSCGQQGSGTYSCNGTCSAAVPSASSCPTNSCPIVNSGSCGGYGSAPWGGTCDAGSYAGWWVTGGQWQTCTATNPTPTCADSGQVGVYPNCSAPPPPSCTGSTVTGRTNYGIWGSSPYTSDSDIGTAAVHAGLLQNGQTGIIKVTQVGTVGYFSSTFQHGVWSSEWAEPWPGMTLTLCSVQQALQPDLVPGAIMPTSVTAGVATTFQAPITNSGNASTGTGFNNLFQRANDSSGNGATDIGAPGMDPLAAGASGTAFQSYTFPSAGTYYMRICADKFSAASTGVITESNEGNCGAWTPITVTAAGVSCSLNASPSTITNGNSTTLTWSSSNATSCTGSGFSTSGATSGSRTISPSSTASYGLSCTNSSSGASCNATPATVTVNGSNCTGPASITITATPARVQPGQTSTITWNANNVPGVNGVCTVSGPGISQNSTADSSASCVLSGSATTPALTTQSTYTISCPGGTTKSVIVNVLPKFEEF